MCNLQTLLGRAVAIGLIASVMGVAPVRGQVTPPAPAPAWLLPWTPPAVPADYRSPSGPHKIVVPTTAPAPLAIMRSVPVLSELAYPGRNLYLITDDVLDGLTPQQLQLLDLRDVQNLIRLRDRVIDTTVPPPDVPQGLSLAPRPGPQLHLIQFVGPVQDDWLSALRAVEGLRIVTYIPENAYLVWADQTHRAELATQAGFQPHVQWEGPFHPDYKLHPALDRTFAGDVKVTVQLFTHSDVSESITTIRGLATTVLKNANVVGVYTNITIEVPASQLETIARLEDVVNVEPFIEPGLFGELQGQILAGSINVAGTGPAAPGYLAWLNGLGFNTNFAFAVDVTDGGFDQGSAAAATVHADLLDALGNSRVAYLQRVNGTTISTTNVNDTGGHGTINCAIVGGFNNTAVAAANFAYFGDANGFRYGLGVAPFALVGSSRVFAPGWTFPDFTTLIDAAYSSGARMSNNSWGATVPTGAYDVVSQEYDGLVRDAQPTGAGAAPSGGSPGNQEMIIVFGAGNSGSGASTVGDNGSTAKNTIVVGASENFAAFGNDGCGIGNAGANNLTQVINFSSRGPTVDGRNKPDLMAPGTHIFGAASQDPGFDGSLVCGSATNDFVAPPADAYFPGDPNPADALAQTLYTWSSGTSHAAPAVAGSAALLRQWFLDAGHPAPSPAMTKAYLVNAATYLTGPADNFYSNTQGMGLVNLAASFDGVQRLLFDQVKTAHNNGTTDAAEVFTVTGQVVDATVPFRVTMAYTDAPGTPTAAVIRNNDLDLEIQVGGNFYRGNNFTQGISNVGAVTNPPDTQNNLESVFLPAGTAGNFTVTVRPTNINSDGVPGNGDGTDQDFALVIYNGEFPARNPVDIMLVLDVSGSMNSTAAGGTDDKIDLLKDAVEMFIRVWEPFTIPDDRMGIVYFSSAIASTFPAAPPLLTPFQPNENAFITDVRAQTAGGCTALGAGILTADAAFDALPDRQRHIIVFTNGMQNRSPMVTKVGAAYQILADASASCGDAGVADLPGINLADYNAKAIHTIGTGVSGASWTTLVTDIASETGGLSHFTSTPDENLEDFFLDALVAALRVDPVEKVATARGTLSRRAAAQQKETFEINATVRKATFAVSWRGDRRPQAVGYTLIAPDGTPVPRSALSFRTGPFYRIASMDFPLQVADSTIAHDGTWQLVFQPNLITNEVSYRVHLIVEDAEVRYHFDVPTAGVGVGETIPISLWAQQGTRTLTDLQDVYVNVARPPVGFGTFMVNHQVSQAQLVQPIDLSGDQFASQAGKIGFILLQDDALRRKLDPLTDRVQLFDDGLPDHGDAKAGDGVYSALYTNTTRPGFYDVAVSFRHDGPGSGPTVRADSKTLSVGIEQFDRDRSTFDIRSVSSDGDRATYEITVMPIDRFDNYLGPGYDVDAVVALLGDKWGGRRVPLTDNLDGSYSGRVDVSGTEVDAGATVRVDIDGRSVTQVALPPRAEQRLALSIHAGLTLPVSDFDSSFDPGILAEVDVEIMLADRLSLETVLGVYAFDPSYEIIGGTAYLKGYLPIGDGRLFGAIGPGVYKPKNVDAAFGISPAAGLDWPIGGNIRGEIGASYFHIFTEGDAIDFFGLKVGVKLGI